VKILDWSVPVSQPIVSPQLSYLVNQVLSDDLARAPTMGYPSILHIGSPTAAKMGVTEDKQSAWTVGYTPYRVIAARIGNKDGSELQIDPRWPTGIWRALMQYESVRQTGSTWVEPAGIIHKDVCDPSGMLPTADCPNIVPEIFLAGNEPIEPDILFQKVAINYETGKLATVFTPADMVTEKVFMIVPKEYQDWAIKAGLPVPPETYDAVRAESTDPAIHFSSPIMFDYVRGKVTISGTASSQEFTSFRIEAGKGLNPEAWIQIGSTGNRPVIEGQLAIWDTTGLDGLYALRLQVIGENNLLKTSTIQVTVDNNPPKITLRTSVDPTEVSVKTYPQILISADIQDETGLKEVIFLLDGKEAATLDSSPFGYLWTTQSGKHTFQVRALDLAGNEQLSGTLELNVNE
jgi:membrane carboxypeptidase/penicillin-binding protein PbpC